MSPAETKGAPTQLSMPGMEDLSPLTYPGHCCSLAPGQRVTYLGRIPGGPPYGSQGTVKEAHRRTALVDMGESGLWRIPYHLLGIPVATS